MKLKNYSTIILNIVVLLIFAFVTHLLNSPYVTSLDIAVWLMGFGLAIPLVIMSIFLFIKDYKRHRLFWKGSCLLFITSGLLAVALGVFDLMVGAAFGGWSAQ